MSLSYEFRQIQMDGGCVCDFDVPCRLHPDTSCGACEYACHCAEHGYFCGDCDDDCFLGWGKA